MATVTYLTSKRKITWDYIKHANRWSDIQLQLAQMEAEINGWSPAMFLPLDEYTVAQSKYIEFLPVRDFSLVKKEK